MSFRGLFNPTFARLAASAWKVVQGDKVTIVSGSGKGQVGEVVKVLRKSEQVIVKDCNMVKRRLKKDHPSQKPEITYERPVHRSRVAIVDPVTNLPTRVKFGFLEDGTKVRIAKRSGAVLPRPAGPARDTKRKEGDLDTAPDLARKVTYSQ
eukprot:CAMPEP_0113895338 /NCGR_PEP_ID=MMETSP0780_2-20120614/17298_1 /TAXON_ID=652834 /ORGANISM="Palpitomonas bilix" /LENGTH=150 /DNA_ID=CAMNT_0000886139 /DNA_START=65 /DNA_END=517 /DNA_ORIENTATION=- /assembly_acc=CAM_ASM_000599